MALAKVGCDPVQIAKMKDGSRLLLDARGRTEGSSFWNGEYSTDEVALLKASYDSTRTFVDIGANVGLITVPIALETARTGATGQVLAIEPVPANFERLRRSIRLTPGLADRVRTVDVALGASDGSVVMTTERDGQSSNAGVSNAGFEGSGRVTVPLRRLDDLLAAEGVDDVDVIKIDVEGYEVDALAGATECLRTMRPIVFGEFHNVLMPARGVTFRDVVDLTRPLGYRYFGFRADLEAVEVPEPAPNFGNAVLVPDERVDSWLETVSSLRALRTGPSTGQISGRRAK